MAAIAVTHAPPPPSADDALLDASSRAVIGAVDIVGPRGARITVDLADGTTRDADLVGNDPGTGLAVLRMNGGPFPWVRLADSSHAP